MYELTWLTGNSLDSINRFEIEWDAMIKGKE